MNKIILNGVVLLAMLSMVTCLDQSSSAQHQHLRSKRGIMNYFKRFWNGRKKLVYQLPFIQSSVPAAMYSGHELVMNPQGPNFYPMYQMNGQQMNAAAAPGGGGYPSTMIPFYTVPPPLPPQQSSQQQPQSSNGYYDGGQMNAASMEPMASDGSYIGGGNGAGPGGPSGPQGQQQMNYYYPAPQQQLQQPQQQPDPQSTGQGYGNQVPYASSSNINSQQVYQGDESMQKPSYYYPQQPQQIGTSPYTFHSNPSQANAFNSKPYGSNPGTIDVHQVLDQFIRSAGLSPHGDHDNVAKIYGGNDDNKALSVKKLYSYPFYFTSSGDRPSRRQSIDDVVSEYGVAPTRMESITQQQHQQPKPSSTSTTTNQILVPHSSSSTSSSSTSDDSDMDSSFIAKNAAALQEFLANKNSLESSQITSSSSGSASPSTLLSHHQPMMGDNQIIAKN